MTKIKPLNERDRAYIQALHEQLDHEGRVAGNSTLVVVALREARKKLALIQDGLLPLDSSVRNWRGLLAYGTQFALGKERKQWPREPKEAWDYRIWRGK